MSPLESMVGTLGAALVGVLCLAMLIPLIFYLVTLHKAVNSLKEARPFPGGLVWLSLIPFLGAIWMIVLMILVPVQLDEALKKRGSSVRAGVGVAIAAVVCAVLSFLVFPGIAALVLWIIHWVKIAGAKNVLLSSAAPEVPAAQA